MTRKIGILLALTAGLLHLTPGTIAGYAQPDRAPSAHEPGELWAVAARLQATLSDEQKAELTSMAGAHEDHRGHDGRMERRRDRMEQGRRHQLNRGSRHHMGHAHWGNAFQDRSRARAKRTRNRRGSNMHFSPAQRTAFRALQAAHLRSMRKLAESRKSDSMSAEDFRSAITAKRKAHREAIHALWTDEQREAIETARNAHAEARRQALGLTAEQDAKFVEMHKRHRAEMQEILKSGDVDKESLKALHESHKAAASEVLTAQQLETAQIHRALLMHAMNNHRSDRRLRRR